jgi:hypothetical protein
MTSVRYREPMLKPSLSCGAIYPSQHLGLVLQVVVFGVFTACSLTVAEADPERHPLKSEQPKLDQPAVSKTIPLLRGVVSQQRTSPPLGFRDSQGKGIPKNDQAPPSNPALTGGAFLNSLLGSLKPPPAPTAPSARSALPAPSLMPAQVQGQMQAQIQQQYAALKRVPQLNIKEPPGYKPPDFHLSIGRGKAGTPLYVFNPLDDAQRRAGVEWGFAPVIEQLQGRKDVSNTPQK